MVPQIGAGVWIEFEQGDPDYPIWVGGFWGSVGRSAAGRLGAAADPAGTDHRAFRSTLQNSIMISDAAPIPMQAPVPAPAPPGTGGIVLRSPTGAMIVVNDTGIYINNGKGASDRSDGTERDDQQSRVGGDVILINARR